MSSCVLLQYLEEKYNKKNIKTKFIDEILTEMSEQTFWHVANKSRNASVDAALTINFS